MSTVSYCSQCGSALTEQALFCSKCGAPVAAGDASASVPLPSQRVQEPKSLLQKEVISDASLSAGCLTVIMWAGFLGAAYFLLFFDPSVSTEAGRVNNIGLMQDRQNYMLFCGGVGVVVLIIKLMSEPQK